MSTLILIKSVKTKVTQTTKRYYIKLTLIFIFWFK